MKFAQEKLIDLQKEIQEVLGQVASKRLTHKEAADKVVHLREQIDKIIEHLNKAAK